MELSLKDIEVLAKLVSDQKLDSLKFGTLEIKKSVHEIKENQQVINTSKRTLSDDELMFAAGADELPPEVVAAFIRPQRRSTEE